jgi:hypothetical protein
MFFSGQHGPERVVPAAAAAAGGAAPRPPLHRPLHGLPRTRRHLPNASGIFLSKTAISHRGAILLVKSIKSVIEISFFPYLNNFTLYLKCFHPLSVVKAQFESYLRILFQKIRL